MMGTEFRLAAYIRATPVTRDFSHSKNCAVSNQVPLGRYFAFVGSLLLVMLFIADWYLPSASSQTFLREARVDKSMIRIKSAHKWPEPMVIDTNLPTIVPPLPVLAKAPIINQPRDALAQLKSPLPKASEYPRPGESEAQSSCANPTGANRGLLSDPGGAARWLVMQNCSAPLVSGAEPNKGFHLATIRFRISNPQVLSSLNRCIPHD
jgi:hypothetical protein